MDATWLGAILENKFFVSFGGSLMPYVNQISDTISPSPYTDWSFQMGKGVYPGDNKCRYE